MNKYPCVNCSKLNEFQNYCDWNCHVAAAKKAGGKEILPNNLPVRCIKADGTMLEHESADHPDYKFPVDVEFRGELPSDLELWDYSYAPQSHALIYQDGSIALTIYEHTYSCWRLSDGQWHSGRYYDKDWHLSKESLEKIKKQ